VIGAAAGSAHTAVWTAEGELFTFWGGTWGLLVACWATLHRMSFCRARGWSIARRWCHFNLVGKNVAGAAACAGGYHTAVWTEAGLLFTFGDGFNGRLGHGGQHDKLGPRLIESLTGKQAIAIGTAAGNRHSAVWTEAAELFTFETRTWGGGPRSRRCT